MTGIDASHAADKLEKEGKTLEKREEAACWQPMKAVLAYLVCSTAGSYAIYLAGSSSRIPIRFRICRRG